eukprot:TRINITY_DN15494_c0_g1_i1.p1 TRINITY_DN15494_c0_g1~~TRINITY_DN15494_c0_g1_i1.p1  ORF type:complete len:350 (+),score=60.49 TRINITY_DN15494_c0_g1_i1:218-1267(+)
MMSKSEGHSMDFLKQKLESVLADARAKQDDSYREIVWKGMRVPINNEKIRLSIINAQVSSADMDKVDSNDEKISLFDKIFMSYSEAQRRVKEDTTISGPNKATLLEYLSYSILKKTIDRNLLLVQSLESKIDLQDFEPDSKKKQAKADELVRLYESLLQNMAEMSELVKGSDHMAADTLDAKTLFFKAIRCFYLAMSYVKNSKWKESVLLYDKCRSYIATATKLHAQSLTADKALVEKLYEIEKKANGASHYARARAYLDTVRAEKTDDKLDSKNVVGDLLSGIDKYDSSFLERKKLVNFPPEYQVIFCKAVLFDVALEMCQFPDLEDRKKPAKSGGWFSSFFSRSNKN